MTAATRVSYVVGRYPAVSHAFISSEIAALRQAGVEVITISIHRAADGELLNDHDRRERERTFSLLPPRLSVLLAAHLRALLRPRAYLRTLVHAFRMGPAGARGRVWQLFYFAEAIMAWRHCVKHGVRHLHAHHLNQASDAALLCASFGNSAGEGDWTWSFTMHGPNEFYDVSRFRLAAKAERASAVVCISDFARSQLMGLTDERVWPRLRVIHCGVDLSRFIPADPRVRADQGDFRILCTGRLVSFKGQSLLLEALARLRDHGVDARLKLVGEGPEHDGLERHALRLGVLRAVEFAGAVGQDTIAAAYAEADVFCLPSFAEGVPVVLMEAMAMKLPVVTTPVMGVGELVRDGVNGLLVAPGRVDHLTDALRRLAADPALGRALGERGRETVEGEFDVRESARQLHRLFRSMACSNGPSDRLVPCLPRREMAEIQTSGH